MHERNLMTNLKNKVEELSRANGGGKVTKVRVALRPFASLSPEHLREHFVMETKGGALEGAILEIEGNSLGHSAAGAQDEEWIHELGSPDDILLKSIDLEDTLPA